MEDVESTKFISGFSTPFGIRLNCEYGSVGANSLHLLCTGMMMSAIMHIVSAVVTSATKTGIHNDNAVDYVSTMLSIFTVFLAAKLFPISSIHASEHQVIHAMEKNQVLTNENIAAQPRIHPHCGTMFSAQAIAFYNVFVLPIPMPMIVKILVAYYISLYLKKPLGTWLQQHLTTKPARPQDIENAKQIAFKYNRMFLLKHTESRTKNDVFKFAKAGFRLVFMQGVVEILVGMILVSLAVKALGWN